jgi:hypothetical protein
VTYRSISKTILAVALSFAWCSVTAAQGISTWITGSTRFDPRAPKAPNFGPSAQQHLDFANKPCVTVQASANVEPNNMHVYEHVLHFDNHCSQPVKIKACYIRSDRCVNERVPGYKKLDSVLGIMADQTDFDFEFKELFP